MVVGFLAIRAVHITQGYLDVAGGWHAYHDPALATTMAVCGTAESTWMIGRSWRRSRIDAVAVAVDVLFGMAALLLVGTSLGRGDRTTSLNWMLPFTVGTTVAAGLTLSCGAGLTLSAGLAVVYLITVWPGAAQGQGSATTALVNAASYLGFFCVATALRIVIFGLVGLLQQARSEAVARGGQLAAEQERARQQRLIHDYALQTLEAIAQGWGEGSPQLRHRARQESQRLRLALRDNYLGEHRGLRAKLDALVGEFACLGLNIDYIDAELESAPPDRVTEALCTAAREALINVFKHAAASTAIVRVATVSDGIELTILDRGRGFDPGRCASGFGVPNSIRRGIAEIGGCAEIRSAPGRGTLVRLWSPT
jgi:signal transduction histidine kinase